MLIENDLKTDALLTVDFLGKAIKIIDTEDYPRAIVKL
jgi:hypothetical protein